MRSIGALMTAALVALAAAQARAEGVDSGTQDASTTERLRGASTLMPMGGGLISLGGASLRYRAKGSKRWETLHRQAGDSLYRVEADDSGRLLAAWEKEPFIHLFTLRPRRHVLLPKPPIPSDIRFASLDRLAFSPNGRDALVFMTGHLKYMGTRHWTAAYRVALDGKSEPELLFRVDDAFPLDTTRNGAVFVMPKRIAQQCDNMRCDPVASIVGYAFSPDGVRQTTLLTAEQAEMDNARLVRGSDDQRVVLMLDLNKKERALLRWRYGDAKADYRPLPRTTGWSSPDDHYALSLVTPKDELIEVQGQGSDLKIVRHLLDGGEQVTPLPAVKDPDARVYAFGVRSQGGLWLHVGDHLVLYTPGKPLRRFSIEPLLERLTEWAGTDVYLPSPESLWVGLEVRRGRDFLRVSFAEVERRAKLWR